MHDEHSMKTLNHLVESLLYTFLRESKLVKEWNETLYNLIFSFYGPLDSHENRKETNSKIHINDEAFGCLDGTRGYHIGFENSEAEGHALKLALHVSPPGAIIF